MRKRTQAREIALIILYQWDIRKDDPLELIHDYFEDVGINDPDIINFTKKLVTGTAEKVKDLDEVISRYADNWQLDRQGQQME